MRIYSVKFRKYDSFVSSDNRTSVSRIIQGKKETIKIHTSHTGDLLVPEFDLQEFESFGNGYEHVKFVGEIHDSYFTGLPSVPRTVTEAKNDLR